MSKRHTGLMAQWFIFSSWPGSPSFEPQDIVDCTVEEILQCCVQFKKLSLAVELAGGTPMLMEEGTDDNEDDILIGDDTCVMQCDTDENTQTMSQNARDWLHYVRDLLKRQVWCAGSHVTALSLAFP